MGAEQALVERCVAARAAGLDFPAIWQTVLHRHPLVAGQPIQVNDGKRAWLEVPLTTGGRIACDAESGYRLVSALEIVRR